jgi:membrane protein DedA with SNARE-associated domain
MVNSLGLPNKMDTESMSEEVKQHWPKKEVYLGVLAIAVTIALCIAAVVYKDELMSIAYMAGYSLLGVLIIAFIAGSTVSITAIPVPYWLLVFTLPNILTPHWGILAPVWVGVISACGATLGQLITFMIGYGGRNLSQKITSKISNRFYTRSMNWAQRHGSWAVFGMSVMLNPLHLPMTIAIATLRYPPHKFLLFSWLGNLIKSLFIAFCGYFGLSSLLQFLGV